MEVVIIVAVLEWESIERVRGQGDEVHYYLATTRRFQHDMKRRELRSSL